ncbi:hypothetical protein PMAYCL1PPCAC_04167, partial [Pristionchus mayeri]
RFNKYLDSDVMDLHYLPKSVAETVLEKRMKEIRNGLRPNVLYVCTGVGNGSRNGVPIIKNYVIEKAELEGIDCT